MATVLTEPTGVAAEEMVHVSIPILKWEEDPDGDLIVKGIATDGTVDSDSQIVDPEWSAKALQTWIATGGNVRQSHDPHRPVGKGLKVEVNKDGGKHWVTSLVVDPLAQKLVKKGVLTAYSVGISRPVIKHDPSGRARGGIIVDGELAELSLVDRPSNKSSYLELAKSAANGTCEFTGKIVGKEILQEMLGDATPATQKAAGSDISAFDSSELANLNITFTPNDMASLVMKKVRDKVISDHYNDLAKDAVGYDPFRYSTAEKRNFDPGVGGGVDRDRLSESDFAGPHRSFPIINQSDVSDALHLVGHADDPAAVRANIKRIAHSKGLSVPDDDSDSGKEDIPELVKDPGQAKPQSVGSQGDAACASPGKEIDASCLDADGDCDGDGVGMLGDPASAKAAKPKLKARMPKPGSKKPKGKNTRMPKPGSKKPKGKNRVPSWLNKPEGGADDGNGSEPGGRADKCHTDPKTAAGATDAADMSPAPVGELMTSPAPSHMKSEAVALRYKTVGIDFDMGALHDFCCPAYSPEEVASYHPLADFRTLINENVWQRKALAAATGRDIQQAMEAQQAWQAAAILKAADPGDLNAYRAELHKAFRDANPGPTSYPSPGTISPQRFCRPVITAGHAQHDMGGYGPPNSAANVATSAPHAQNFNRPPLGSAHSSPSPSHMKATWPYPEQQGVPTMLTYPETEREKNRRALSMMHDHLIHMFPSVCPIDDKDAYAVERNPTTTVPSIAGISKEIQPEAQAEVLSDVYKYIKKLEKQVRAGKITEEEARERLSRRTAEKYARNLAKDVQKGMTSIDQVAKALGIERPEPVREIKVEAPPAVPDVTVKSLTPDVMKSMMSEVIRDQIAPLQEQLAASQQKNTEYQDLLKAQQDRLDQYDKRWEALANTANPNSNPLIPGLMSKNARPAALQKQAQVSEQVQGMMMRQLERTWRTSENPAEREAAYTALNKMKNDSF